MSVVLRGDIWWVRLQFNGEMIQKSTRFRYKDKALAQLYEDNLRRELALSGMSENNRRCEPSDTLAATDSIEAKSIDERLEDIVRIVETTAKSVEILAVSQRETKKEVSEITGLPSFRKRYISAKQVAEIYGFSERELDKMRRQRTGPPFRCFRGTRTRPRKPMYEVRALEKWIAERPGDGNVNTLNISTK